MTLDVGRRCGPSAATWLRIPCATYLQHLGTRQRPLGRVLRRSSKHWYGGVIAYLYPVSADIWLGAATTLIGAGLGGAISLALNRQQMSGARVQRAEDDQRLRRQRSETRRFDAYSQFSLALRSYRDAIRPLERQSTTQVSLDNMAALAKSVNDTSAIVFFIAESDMTYEACRATVQAVHNAQNTLHKGDRSQALWAELNSEIAQLVREFQVAARNELGVAGIDRSKILNRKIGAQRIMPAADSDE
jgi:hypothetical protein